MSPKITKFYEFASFRLDPSQKFLLWDGKPVPLTPKVFDTLEILIENAGRLLEKDELMRKIWHDHFVEESNLTSNIKMLRKALGDDAAHPRFIETVPKRGYRFIAEVRRIEEDEENGRSGEVEIKIDPSTNFSHFSVSTSHRAQPSGKVVALADWKRDQNKPEDFDFAPEEIEAKPAKLELVPAISSVRNKRKSYLFVLAGLISVVVLAGFGYGIYRFLNRAASPDAFRMSNLTRLTSNGKTKLAAVSPNGEFIAYVLGR